MRLSDHEVRLLTRIQDQSDQQFDAEQRWTSRFVVGCWSLACLLAIGDLANWGVYAIVMFTIGATLLANRKLTRLVWHQSSSALFD